MKAEQVRKRRLRPCEYGVLSITCGSASAVRRRRRFGGMWDLCEKHAAFLDRLDGNIRKHKPLLDRLAGREGGDADGS